MRRFQPFILFLILSVATVVAFAHFAFAIGQVEPTAPNPARVIGAREQSRGGHPAIGFEFFDGSGSYTSAHRYAYIRQQGGMVVSSSYTITNGIGGATTGHWDKDGSLTVTSCTGCSSGSAFADPYTPPTGTFTVNGNVAVASHALPSGTLAYVGYDGNENVVNAPANKVVMLAVNNSVIVTAESTPGSRAVVSGNGGGDGLVVGGTLVINGQGTGTFNTLSATATTVTTLHATGTITADSDINATAGNLHVATATVDSSLASNGPAVFSSSISRNVSAKKTANYSAQNSDHLILVDVNGALGSFTVTLPSASGATEEILVKCTTTHATRRITIGRAGGDTITTNSASGQTSIGSLCSSTTLPAYRFESDGSSVWYQVDDEAGI